jgi:hypothetical protein
MDSDFGTISVHILGARPDTLNGIYERDGKSDGVWTYSKNGVYQNSDVKCTIYRVSCTNKKQWLISLDADFFGLSQTLVFYSAAPSKNNSDYPPSKRWVEKLPTVRPRDRHPLTLLRVEQNGATSTDILHVSGIIQKILFSERFCDIRFVCGDGVIVNAHRIILAESSSYFDTAFNGPWKENDSGTWETSHSSHAIKAMLSLLYTGKNDFVLVDGDPLASLSVASEYGVPDLKSLAERCIARLVKESNIKDMLQAAHLYDSTMLKKVCVDFVKNNPFRVLAHSDISSLKTEAPDLWEEFIKEIVPQV